MAAIDDLLALIASGESRSYDELYSDAEKIEPKPITQMTVDEVIALQSRMLRAGYKSTAAGKFQDLRATLEDMVAAGVITRNDRFDVAHQNKGAKWLMERRGLDNFLAGTMSATDFANNLAREWASLPVVTRIKGAHRTVEPGQSYYAGDGLNRASHRPAEVLDCLARLKAANSKKAAPEPTASMLQMGDRGTQVEAIQRQLVALGYPIGAIDGRFGPETDTQVRAFQRDNGLAVDGKVGKVTWAALDTAEPRKLSEARQNATVSDLAEKGSTTIADAAKGKAAVVVTGTVAAVGKTIQSNGGDPLDAAQHVADKVAAVHGIAETFADVGQWFVHNPIWLLGVAALGGTWWFLHRAQKARLEDHRTGLNLGR